MARKKNKGKKSSEKGTWLDKLSLALTLVVVSLFAIFLGFLIGQYAIGWVASPPVETASDHSRGDGSRQEAPIPRAQPSTSPAERPGSVPIPTPAVQSPSSVAASRTLAPTEDKVEVNQPREAGRASEERQTIVRVHVGRFQSRDTALELAERLKNETPPIHDAWVLFDQSAGEYRVQAGAFSSSARAEELVQKLRTRNLDAFLVP